MTAVTAQLSAAQSVSGPEPDWDYLAGHGLDRVALQLRFPLGADWHTLRCRVHPDCDGPATASPWLCPRCLEAWRAAGGRTLYVADWGRLGEWSHNGHTVTPVSVAVGEPGLPIRVGNEPVQLAITPDGRTLFVVTSNGTVTPP